ncbi:unnamed protein product [Nyctereutes procyonoides]|uniref:(raccoon dog) hypothetical protein n=1 Tax=Nyctereutes procyonoides TaxID=34880 RepID=A0A811ZB42_NYCPR|nr:unnamed protein product [Nyctereutes procyonoides]
MQEDPETLLALQRANNSGPAHQAGSTQDLSLCKVTNHQGFLQDKELPGPSPREAKKLRQETRRADKWIKMLKRWDHYLPSEKPWAPLTSTAFLPAAATPVYKGVPPQVREQVWLRLLNVDQVKARNAGKYQEMKEAALVSSQDIEQIDLDINRTFRSHTMFWDRYGVGQRALFHVLAAYSVYDTEVGYCQGMSEIAAILLMFLPEEDAFWALAQLMTGDRHAMHGFFVPGFPKLLRFQAHHERVLQRALPDLKKHMDEEQMSTGIYTPRWFLQCFLCRTPFSLTLKLWDTYILDGEQVLTAMAYTILKVHRKRLLKLPLEGLRQFLQDSLARPWALEDEAVLRHLRASMTQLRRMRCDLTPPATRTPSRPGHHPTSPPAVELPPHPPSATRRCRQAAPGHGGLQDKKRGLLPFGTCLGHPRGPATDQALEHPGTPITGSPQPPRDDAVGPRTPFLPRGYCSSCPSLGSDRHSQGRARAALSPLSRGPAQARDPLPSTSTGQLGARGPQGQSVAVRAGAQRLWPAVTVPCLISLSLPEGGTPRTGHQPLTQRDLGWPGLGSVGAGVTPAPPQAQH